MLAKRIAQITAILAILMVATPLVHAPSTTTIIAPIDNKLNLAVGSTFYSTYIITNPQNAYAWQFNVTFDKTHINVQSITILSPWTGGYSTSSYDNTAGKFLVAFTFTGSTTYSNSGTVNLFKILFQVKAAHHLSTYHLVTTSEDSSFGAIVIDHSLHYATLSLEDGQFCNQSSCPN